MNFGEQNSAVGCILVNYRSPWDMLEKCLRSVFETNKDVRVRVILVDNASGDGILDQVSLVFPQVNIVEMTTNAGFAAAVNRGLAEVTEPFVLTLNTDTVLTAGAVDRMVKALGDAGDEVAGVAPKMLSSSHQGVIDAIGTVMPPTGASFNRGIGQCDLGQYDQPDEVAGVCFGATLLKRSLFDPQKVGPLFEGYFLYFEDSDWCMRATGQGYRFFTVPEAVVLHLHSGVTRHESLDLKYRLIELNTLRIVMRTFESPLLVLRIVTARCARLLARTLIRRRFISANLSTLASFFKELPRLINERRQIRKKRTVSDRRVFWMSVGEDAFFDTVEYRPQRCLESLAATYQRLQRQKPDPQTSKALTALHQLKLQTAAPGTPGSKPKLSPETESLFAEQPQCVRDLITLALHEE